MTKKKHQQILVDLHGPSWLMATFLPVTLLCLFLVLGITPALSQAANDPSENQTRAGPLLQATDTPTSTSSLDATSTFILTFGDLGYNEISLDNQTNRAEYTFRLPTNIQLQEGNFIEFDLSYHYSSLITSAELPLTYGDIIITLNGQTLKIFSVPQPALDHYRLQVPVPSNLLDTTRGRLQTIEVKFDGASICAVPYNSILIIHPTSHLTLNYTQSPLLLDLATYPAPFYQRSFESDQTLFVIPAQPSPAEAAGAASIAAKLGHLTDNRLIINASFDLDLVDQLASAQSALASHLLVIGQPEHNRLLPILNQLTSLPAPFRERQMELVTQGPIVVSPGQRFTYTFTVTNTTDQEAMLSLVETLPDFTEFVACKPRCLEDRQSNTLTWARHLLKPAQSKTFSLVLQTLPAMTSPYLENTVTLVEGEMEPINVDTLISQVSLEEVSAAEQQISTPNETPYFFVHNGRAVAEADGILQEIASPWHENKAILIVTGLNEEALRKASQALSSEAYLPGLSGQLALVQDVFLPEIELTSPPAVELTFQDLGYEDRVIRGQFNQRIHYSFFIPLHWQLTKSAFLDLAFSHSQFTEQANTGITIFLNELPVATLALDQKTAVNGRQKITLPASAARPGEFNRLTIQFIPSGGGGAGCAQLGIFKDFWFVASSNSKIFLAHTEKTNSPLSLDVYPYPFNNHSSLMDLLFALPETPTSDEWQSLLRLAASLGNSTRGQAISPSVTIGENLSDHNLADYHIIAIGRPSRNPLIQAANAHLPQPFSPTSDQIKQQLDNLILRLPAEAELGYLQLIPSPWNGGRTFLAITGTTNESVVWAAQILYQRNFGRLSGNLTLIRNSSNTQADSAALTVNYIDTRQ